MTNNKIFNKQETLHHIKHYLPSQSPLKDFIHHNSLHPFQQEKFYPAIFKASKIFGYQVTLQLSDYRGMFATGRIKPEILERCVIEKYGALRAKEWLDNALLKEYDENVDPRIGFLRSRWKNQYKLDIDTSVHPFLFRVICSYLDQGIAHWQFPVNDHGFLASVLEIQKNSFAGFFRTKRVKKLVSGEIPEMETLLTMLVGNEAYFEQYLWDQQFSHRGWSGMVSTIEDRPEAVLSPRVVSLEDLIVFELLLELDTLEYNFGSNWKPLTEGIDFQPMDLMARVDETEVTEVFQIWQNAFEWSYYDSVLRAIELSGNQKTDIGNDLSFQAVFCIDERECSIRRHLEHADPRCETLGMPGFFGVEFYFRPFNAKFIDKLCPAPVTPNYLIKEVEVSADREHDLLYTDKTHTLFWGYLTSFTHGFMAVLRLIKNIFRPEMSPAISNAFTHMNSGSVLTVENKSPEDREDGLQVGFTVIEMADRVENALRGMGLTKDFAPLVYIVAHGSSSANNPHHGAHDCGACSGRPGSVNARVFAIMANHSGVRDELKKRGLWIPPNTHFVGALHDTASDQIEFYDESLLTGTNRELHTKNKATFESALDGNARERSRRFASIDTTESELKVREAIKKRSVSLFEPRPELGHGTNSLCIIGRRSITKKVFLDRRAFLNSYDYRLDPAGERLGGIMRPIGPVCGGINLEYYFSRVDNYKLGAGTKLPHNIMGLIGVANSSDGDLRPGLPLQMIEVHDPVRLLVLVEHKPEVVLKTIQSDPSMYEWYENEWIHLMVLEPEKDEYYIFKNGQFQPYKTKIPDIKVVKNSLEILSMAKEMVTNHIIHATEENLPVFILNN